MNIAFNEKKTKNILHLTIIKLKISWQWNIFKTMNNNVYYTINFQNSCKFAKVGQKVPKVSKILKSYFLF